MATEIEAKMKVEDFEPVRESLRGAGAALDGQVMETNSFFDTADRSLQSVDKGLRLRRARRVLDGGEKYLITVKGPQQAGALKSREEAQVHVDDPAAAIAVFRLLGFEPTLSFEKRRETWLLDDCTVELDELPILGRFVEIEGPREASVMRVREKLNLSGYPLIKTGYTSMLAARLGKNAPRPQSITFPGNQP